MVQQLLLSMFPFILTFHFDLILGSFWLFAALIGCSISALSCSFDFVVCGGGGGSQRLPNPNPTTVLAVLLLGLWLLLGCDNT